MAGPVLCGRQIHPTPKHVLLGALSLSQALLGGGFLRSERILSSTVLSCSLLVHLVEDDPRMAPFAAGLSFDMNLRREYATIDNRGPIIEVSTWVIMVIAVLAVIVKVSSKWLLVSKFQLDDLHVLLSMVCAIVYSIVIHTQVTSGLGRHLSTLDDSQRMGFEKTTYTNQIFYIACLGFAKWGILEFLLTLARTGTRLMVTRSLTWLNIVITTVSIFVIAFQCGVPRPWGFLEGKCMNYTAFWSWFGAMDFITDLSVLALPIYLLHDLQIPLQKRINALTAFCLRVLTLPVIVIRLFYIIKAANSQDQPYDDYATAVSTSVHIATSLLVTCIPFMKPILEGLQSGIFVSKIDAEHTGTGSRGYARGGSKQDSRGAGSRLSAITLKPLGSPKPKPKRVPSTGSESNLIHKRVDLSVEYEAATSQDTGKGDWTHALK